MFLRFGIENHLSLHQPQELTFVASSLKDRKEGLIDCPAVPSGAVVPAAVVYGPNASGKTNLVDAIQFLHTAVLRSHTEGDAEGGVPRRPYKLDPLAASEPTRCEVDFLLDNVRHHYGFTATADAFESEWLYYFPASHRRRLFERTGADYRFGRDLGGQNAVITDLTRPNSLFVSAAAQNGHEYLSRVVSLLRSIQIIRNVDVPGPAAIARLNEQAGIDRRVIDFLQRAGTGVVGYERHEVGVSEKEQVISREVFGLLRRLAEVDEDELPNPDDTKVVYELTHLGSEGKLIALDLDHESAGTRRLLLILGGVFNAIDEGNLLVVDEFDASLHTQVCEAVLGIFCDGARNPHGAQLLVTTHDTNLMVHATGKARGLLRRDQLWFVDKDRTGATELYPLTDYSTRKADNFERGYLEGRYGAVPFDARWAEHAKTID